jgi:sulfur carrier protein
MSAVRVTVNGAERTLTGGLTLADLVAEVAGADRSRGVAVARNGEVVPRSGWSSTGLAEGDRIELVAAAQGG